MLPYSFYQNLEFSETQRGLGFLSEMKPPGTGARPGGMSTKEPQQMGQTTALARPDYSITTDRRC